MTHSTFRFSMLALCLLGGATSAAPAAVPQEATRDELRACMNAKDDLAAQREKFKGRIAEHDLAITALQAEGASLKALKPTAAAGDAKMIEEFNRKLVAYNAASVAANANAATIEAEQTRIEATIADYNNRCAGIIVLPADRAAVLKEREKSVK